MRVKVAGRAEVRYGPDDALVVPGRDRRGRLRKLAFFDQ
jgi:hypothetical protein